MQKNLDFSDAQSEWEVKKFRDKQKIRQVQVDMRSRQYFLYWGNGEREMKREAQREEQIDFKYVAVASIQKLKKKIRVCIL